MAREIPEAVRAAAGLAATVLDEARRLPETLPGLPVRVLGMAMQLSMKLQQHYTDLVARGDELFTGIRGENEPGLATFDDDDEPAGPVASAAKVGQSAFDRVAETVIEVTEDDGTGIDAGDDSGIDAGHDVAAAADRALDELALDELVDEAPAELIENTVDVLSPDGEVQTVEATVTDEGVAAPETSPAEAGTATDEGSTTVASTAPATSTAPVNSIAPPATPPVDGYDDWSLAQLRGRLRGYQAVTVTGLLSYEESTRAREPYLRMLRNRLEKLDEQAVEASPLAPRGT